MASPSATKSAPASANASTGVDSVGICDARRLEDLRPPDDPLGEGHQRRQAPRLRASMRLPEHHIVRSHFACSHRVVARVHGSRADDPLRFQALDRLDKILPGARDMDAICAKSGRQPGVIFNQERTVGVLRGSEGAAPRSLSHGPRNRERNGRARRRSARPQAPPRKSCGRRWRQRPTGGE